MKTIDIEYAKTILDYNPETGIFTRKVSLGRGKAGTEAGHFKKNKYQQMYVKGCRVSGHRLAWAMHYGEFPNCFIDHINGDPRDNRISNLRLCTSAENVRNSCVSANNYSGFKGVTWNKRKMKWEVSICTDYVNKYIGSFDMIKDAALAYKEAAIKYHGEFARA